MDYSLFEEASIDHEAEATQRRMAYVRQDVQEIFPFLAMASGEAEYAHRKALIQDRLVEIASHHEASLGEVEQTADRMFALLHEGRTAVRHTAGGTPCQHCDHYTVDHSEGLPCGSCGCTSYTPQDGSNPTDVGVHNRVGKKLASPQAVATYLKANPQSKLASHDAQGKPLPPAYVRAVKAAMKKLGEEGEGGPF